MNFVKNYLIPACSYREDLQWLSYAEEADLLKAALFGFTAEAWRDANPEPAGKSNVRDYAAINELAVLSNLPSCHDHREWLMGRCLGRSRHKLVYENL